MKYKIIEESVLEELYPNDYNVNVLKKYGLMDWKLNTSFRYYYSCYRYVLEMYLNKVLHLDELNEQIKKISSVRENNNLYSKISNLGLDAVYVRNNIFLDRLTEEEFQEFKIAYENQDYVSLENIVVNTYKRVIPFSSTLREDEIVYYEKNGVSNQSLLLEVNVFANDAVEEFLKEKEKEFSNLLLIPVNILVASDVSVAAQEIKELNGFTKKKRMFKEYPKFLPIGSVVMLKKAYKKLMIVGYTPVNLDKKDKIYDYLGCIYPEGMIVTDYNIMFNHNDIDVIYAVGMMDEDAKKFLEEIKEFDGNKNEKKRALDIIEKS